ncbi:MAG: (d)CMP kinase [Rhizobiaceae bacterium]|nr:(d)CMP kinase [Rhizobiaceae bacterium]
MIIAIDGPAASGKGTLARKLAEHFDLPHLDTGLSYRGVAYALLEDGAPLDDPALAKAAANAIDLVALDRDLLSAHEVGEAASKIAVMSEVRRILVEKQRAFAGNKRGAILDGRDIGTVVCPEADVKLYVTASAEARAARRFLEAGEKGSGATRAQILEDIVRRDERDTGRADSPLRPAEDAHLLDTSEMSIEQAFEAALGIIEDVSRAS